MRRLVTFDRVTADGYFSAPDGKLDWAVPDPAVDQAGAGSIPSFDTILFGRKTYDMFESFWPHALDDSATAANPHDASRRTPEMKAMAIGLTEMTKIVYSRTRKEVAWKNSRIVSRFDPADVAAMKRGPGKGIIVFGSGSLVSQLAEHDLVDEYQLVVNPILIGSGRPLVSGVHLRQKLDLVEARSFASGNVMLRYAPAKPTA